MIGSRKKRPKLSKEINVKQGEDRISTLPSNLISHILSFVPTKYAVATSVLSTKWKQFWTLITSVDFDDKLLLRSRKFNPSHQLNFTGFVHGVLDRVSSLQKFRLKCVQRNYDVSLVNAWVAATLMYHIQELDLFVLMKHSTDHVLPLELFSCKTLVVLKLGTKFVMNVPTLVCLLSLKILHLDIVKFSDDDSIKRLLRGCPVLDELHMNKCVGKNVRVVHILAPVLTKLIYSFPQKDLFLNFDSVSEYKIVLDTPALLYLKLDDNIAEIYLAGNLCHLVKADVNIGGHFYDSHSNAMTELLIGISDVQCLNLRKDMMEAIDRCNCQLPVLPDLTTLELGAGCYAGGEFISWLLEKSPCLETLVFDEFYNGAEYDEHDDRHWHPPQNLPSCLHFHLKVIKIMHFLGDEEELKMVEYFLKNAEVLEKFIIHSDIHSVEEAFEQVEVAEISRKLLMLPRGSKTCQVEHRIITPDSSDF